MLHVKFQKKIISAHSILFIRIKKFSQIQQRLHKNLLLPFIQTFHQRFYHSIMKFHMVFMRPFPFFCQRNQHHFSIFFTSYSAYITFFYQVIHRNRMTRCQALIISNHFIPEFFKIFPFLFMHIFSMHIDFIRVI